MPCGRLAALRAGCGDASGGCKGERHKERGVRMAMMGAQGRRAGVISRGAAGGCWCCAGSEAFRRFRVACASAGVPAAGGSWRWGRR